MKKHEVQIGETYVAKVSGLLAPVKITGVCPHGGWDAANVRTNKQVHIKSAMRLRRSVKPQPSVTGRIRAATGNTRELPGEPRTRSIHLPDGRRITVDGHGANMRWMGHGVSQFDGKWWLASPDMRKLIEIVEATEGPAVEEKP